MASHSDPEGVLTTTVCVIAGFGIELFMLAYAPAMIGHMLMGFFFGWLPHHPHNALGRYTNTRVTLFPGSSLLSFGHDVHLIHHMLPRVPHYRMHAVFRELRPTLEANGTRIEGPRAGPGAPPI